MGKLSTPTLSVPSSFWCPQGIVLPLLPPPVLRGTVVSSEFIAQCLPGNVAALVASEESIGGVCSVVPCRSSTSGHWATTQNTPEVSLDSLGLFENVESLINVSMGPADRDGQYFRYLYLKCVFERKKNTICVTVILYYICWPPNTNFHAHELQVVTPSCQDSVTSV